MNEMVILVKIDLNSIKYILILKIYFIHFNKMSRRIFNYDNIKETKIVENLTSKRSLYENTISACGCLFYKIVKKKIQLLLISYSDPKWPKLDDFGGKISEDDDSLIDAMVRETLEESNHKIKEKVLRKKISKGKPFYYKQSKYYVVAMEVDDDFFPDTKIFGDFEETDNIKRKLKWYDFSSNKKNLAFRLLKNEKLMTFFNKKLQDLEDASSSESSDSDA